MKASLFPQALKQLLRHPHYMRGLVRKKINLFRRYHWIAQHAADKENAPLPLIYKLDLTHACNLRCTGCFQWGQQGWCSREGSQGPAQELDWNILEKLFSQVGKDRPDFNLIGGEPLLYSRFRDLAALLKQYRYNATICTNGTELTKYTDIIATNPYLAFLVSLDGLHEINDGIRGNGTYKKVTQNIKALKQLRRSPYIGIQITIRPENVGHLYAFCREMARLGVDWILINLFWFITEKESCDYERFIRGSYGFTPEKHHGFRMPYTLDRSAFVDQYSKIRQEHFPMQISCYLKTPKDINAYIDDASALVRNRICYKQWIRAEILPDGTVTPCIQFPDLVFGNLHNESIREIWNNKLFKEFRKRARGRNHPLCGKCPCIYLYDAGRKTL